MTATIDSLDRASREHARQIAELDRRISAQEKWAGTALKLLVRLEASLKDVDLVRHEMVGLRTLVAAAIGAGSTTHISDRPVSHHDFDKRMSQLEGKRNQDIIL